MAKTTEKKNGVWKMELDRFGYTLVVMGKTAEECENAMREEYIKAYADLNELDEQTCRLTLEFPAADMDEDGNLIGNEDNPYNVFAEYYRIAFEEHHPQFYTFGEVEWE